MKTQLFLALLIFAQPLVAATLQEALHEYGIKVEGGGAAAVTKNLKQSGQTKSQHVIEAETPAHERFEIKVIAPIEAGAAGALIESENTAIKKLFSAAQ